MKKKRFNEVQIINILKEYDAGCKVDEICRRHEISNPTFYNWKAKYGGMDVSEAKRLRDLDAECQTACKNDPFSALNFDPSLRLFINPGLSTFYS